MQLNVVLNKTLLAYPKVNVHIVGNRSEKSFNGLVKVAKWQTTRQRLIFATVLIDFNCMWKSSKYFNVDFVVGKMSSNVPFDFCGKTTFSLITIGPKPLLRDLSPSLPLLNEYSSNIT